MVKKHIIQKKNDIFYYSILFLDFELVFGGLLGSTLDHQDHPSVRYQAMAQVQKRKLGNLEGVENICWHLSNIPQIPQQLAACISTYINTYIYILYMCTNGIEWHDIHQSKTFQNYLLIYPSSYLSICSTVIHHFPSIEDTQNLPRR